MWKLLKEMKELLTEYPALQYANYLTFTDFHTEYPVLLIGVTFYRPDTYPVRITHILFKTAHYSIRCATSDLYGYEFEVVNNDKTSEGNFTDGSLIHATNDVI
jgi:hypothetical protein